jgi:hypothetical protein
MLSPLLLDGDPTRTPSSCDFEVSRRGLQCFLIQQFQGLRQTSTLVLEDSHVLMRGHDLKLEGPYLF